MKTSLQSPFFRRSYGGFSKENLIFLREHIDASTGNRILDPFAGQAPYLCDLAWEGWDVYLGDINPALLLLAKLRSPCVVSQRLELYRWFLNEIRILKRRRKRNYLRYTQSWFAEEIVDELRDLVRRFGLSTSATSLKPSSEIWSAGSSQGFALGLLILAARELGCYRESDNITWLKQGGIMKVNNAYETLETALDAWLEYVSIRYSHKKVIGTLVCRPHNAEKSYRRVFPHPDIIVTSPPYANRLDYSRLWGMETELLHSLFGISTVEIKRNQVGSTVVSGRVFTIDDLARIPRPVKVALRAISQDNKWKASHSYYYPYFKNFAVGLSRSLEQMAVHVRPQGKIMIIFRDTTRKGIVFPTFALVGGILKKHKFREMTTSDQSLRRIDRHIGQLRKRNLSHQDSLVQTEWTKVYVRKAIK